jgi:hypothetical protein
MILTTVSVEFGFPWSTIPARPITRRANAESISEIGLQRRVNRCVLEVEASKSREFESSHLTDHVGDGIDDLEMFGA